MSISIMYIYIYGSASASLPQWGWVFSLASYGSPPVACGGGVFPMLVMGGDVWMYGCMDVWMDGWIYLAI